MWLLICLCVAVMSVFLDPFFSKRFGTDRGHRWWDGSECWRGYYQSLRPTQLGLSLNIGTDLFQKKNQFVENYTSWYWKAELSNSLYSFNLGIVCISHTQVVVLFVCHHWFRNYVYAIGICVSSSGGIQTNTNLVVAHDQNNSSCVTW